MKTIILFISVLIVVLFASDLKSQAWTDNLPQGKLQSGELTFYEIQKAFNDYWEPLNVKDGYYKNQQGEMVKAPGWKQFRRWEYYWQPRIVKETGQFPKTSASEELEKFSADNPGGKSPNGNWTSLGPTSSAGGYAGLGRVNCVGFVSGDNNTIYIGSPSGGIWKTANGGTNWAPLGDQNAVLGVSDIVAYRPVSLPDVIYIATGDRDGGSMWSLGGGNYNDNNSVGVLKSTDGGTTWNTTGLTFTPSQYITVNRLLLSPANNAILYAATSDGLYKTTNAGTNWTKISTIVFIDMEFKPGTPATIYGSTFSGAIFRSINDGATWTQTLFTSDARTELAVSANNSAIVYAIVSNTSNGLAGIYKSTNSGASFAMIFSGATTNMLNSSCGSTTAGGQASYDLCIAADPTNADIVFIGGVNTWKSTNGGTAWTLSNVWTSTLGCGAPVEVHADKHCLAYQNGTSNLFEGNDGGVYKTVNSGVAWTYIGSGIVTSQIYRLGVAQTVTNENIIGLQDNGTKAFLSGAWSDELGGDGMDCAIDYTNENTMYGELQNGALRRSTNHGANWSVITAGLSGSPSWVSPFTIDPNVNTTVYYGYQDVFKSTNQGTAWTQISAWGGANILSLRVAPSNSAYIYAATSSILYRTTNGGTTWTNITGTIPVGSGDITSICVKNNDPNTAWVSLGGYNSSKIYQTINGGTTWTNISGGLPSIPAMCVIQNKQNTTNVELYAGTDVGVYVKVGAANWALFSTGLPNVVVTELEIYYNATAANSRIRAATSGRGLWQSDLVSAAASQPPVADFVASTTSPIVGTQVDFTDLSTNSPTSWNWSFSPATIIYLNGTTTASQNPQVQFTAAGSYTVTLTATNALGSDPETKTNYINTVNCTVTSFPWNEGFENGGSIPACWTKQFVTGTLDWTYRAGTIPASPITAAHTGSYNAYFYEGDYATQNVTKLVTPPLNIAALSNPQLKFWHTQGFWSPDQDELRIYYKTSFAGSWILLATYTNDIPAWTQETIDLPGQSVDYYIAFEGTEKYGFGICLDDVQVTCTPVPVSISVSASSNPSCAGTSVTFTATPVNGGASPAYQWKVNGANVSGATNATYSFIPVNGNTVSCVLTSNAPCKSGNPATSNTITMTVFALPSATRTVTGITVTSGQSFCYDATQTVTVTGLLVQTGGTANVIAGQNILFKPGTMVLPGGYLHGFISSNCLWCNAYPNVNLPSSQPGESYVENIPEPLISQQSGNFLKVYPNPTTGVFIIELSEVSEKTVVNVEIYGMRGENLFNDQYKGEKQHQVSLEGRPSGIYYIRVKSGNVSESVKILKN
ncbi:MAG: T9SS type A sorting domain-containing protein [Bacteroidales bacterium]